MSLPMYSVANYFLCANTSKSCDAYYSSRYLWVFLFDMLIRNEVIIN